MRLEHAKVIVDEHCDWFRYALGLNHWTIHVVYKRLDEGNLGRCYANAKYSEATIELDEEQIPDGEKLLFVLRHELLHVLHADYDLVVEAALKELDSRVAHSLMIHMQHVAQEKVVTMLEGMLDRGLGATPGRLVGVAKACRELAEHP